MKILDYLKNNLLILDGGMGTLLQAKGLAAGELPERWNVSHPEVIRDIHREYFDAGSNVVSTNTFGANLLKFSRYELDEIVCAAVRNAREAQKLTTNGGETFVALDVGPSGRLLKPYGDFDFEDAVALFSETVKLGVKYGVDLIFIETMNDSYETKAALLAAKESCSLPVFVSNAYSSDSRLMTGASPAAMVAMLEGMGADAIGANCSLGPRQLIPVVEELLKYASVPVLLKPNAGLPEIRDGKTVYDITPDEFGQEVANLVKKGVRICGGCCGTTPEYIRAVVGSNPSIPANTVLKEHTLVSSYTGAVELGISPVLIGERINPTGKKRFKQALRDHDLDFILKEGLDQEEAGVHILDVNVGLPEINEAEMIREVVCELQAVCALPLQIDTADPEAMEAALRRYNGKAMINSVNGKEESMRAVFPLVKKYGGVVVALTLDEDGIPETVDGRFAIAQRILSVAAEYGIAKKDIIFDTLTMTVSASPDAAKVTLGALRRIREELGANTVLGVSNVSFGLPCRDLLNSAFFTCALENGLSAAIMNPYSAEMMKAYYTYRALHAFDENCADYISFASRVTTEASVAAPSPTATITAGVESLKDAIIKGLKDKSRELTVAMLGDTDPLEIVKQHIIPALDIVGKGFEDHTVYLPGLLMSAEAAKAAFEPISERLASAKDTASQRLTVIMATVKGDIHDIGKNIVCLILENYGFKVIDLGRDVAPERILEVTLEHHAPIVGLSALMTTTVPAMEETIKLLREKAPFCRVIVGGAVLTEEYASMIGADKYAADAMETVRYAESIEAEFKRQ
ncbi:MAG: homocysteine S-methyltransferase family protein [Clostridia bacterium]|nr:homocysteine S-methyltransferase family protein [Clostridia bacterium]